MKSTRTASMLTLLAMVAVSALGYFLLISPKRSDAAALKTEKASQDSANRALQAKVDLLTKQAKGMPAIQAELAKYAKQLPDNPALPALIRTLTAAADEAGVAIVSVAPAKPVEVITSATTPVSAAPKTTAKTGTTTTTPAPAKVAPVGERLFAIPLSIQVRGGYFEVETFLSALESLQRSTLVGTLALAPGAEADIEAFGGSLNDLDATIAARVFMIQKAAATPTVTAKKPASAAAAK